MGDSLREIHARHHPTMLVVDGVIADRILQPSPAHTNSFQLATRLFMERE